MFKGECECWSRKHLTAGGRTKPSLPFSTGWSINYSARSKCGTRGGQARFASHAVDDADLPEGLMMMMTTMVMMIMLVMNRAMTMRYHHCRHRFNNDWWFMLVQRNGCASRLRRVALCCLRRESPLSYKTHRHTRTHKQWAIETFQHG